jgi:hypothetical protein
MFSKPDMESEMSSTYISIPRSGDLFIQMINDIVEEDAATEISLRDILEGACHTDTASMISFEVAGHGFFLLWTARIRARTTKSLDEAFYASQNFIEHTSQPQVCIMINAERDKSEEIKNSRTWSTLVVLARYTRNLACSLGLPLRLQDKIARTNRSTKREEPPLGPSTLTPALNRPILGALFCLFCIFSFVLVTRYFMGAHSPDIYHSWIAYNTRGSIGPKYQLSITAANASSWTSSVNNSGDWVLRIDDQAIIPSHLVDDEEKYYQEWFRKEYPAMNQIRLNHDHLNETWLSSPAVDQVPADDLFHFSHCALALRRYIKAKETGRHVCGRDIDYEHIHHCLDALDWWAFPDRGRMECFPNPKRPFGWRTKVCFE